MLGDPSKARYPYSLIGLHWITAVLVVSAYLLSKGGASIRTHPPTLHMAIGSLVLLLVAARVTIRAIATLPPAVGVASRIRIARLGHILLYLLLVAVPLSGWFVASRQGSRVSVLGITLPELTHPLPGPAGFAAQFHQLAGNALVVMAGIHAALALWHHCITKDDTLKRMSPFQS